MRLLAAAVGQQPSALWEGGRGESLEEQGRQGSGSATWEVKGFAEFGENHAAAVAAAADGAAEVLLVSAYVSHDSPFLHALSQKRAARNGLPSAAK